VDAQRQLVHGGAFDTGVVERVLGAPALLEAREGAMLAGGVHERVATRVDLRLAATEVERCRVLCPLGALDVGLHREQVGAAGVARRAAALAGIGDTLRGGVQLVLAAPVMGEAGGQLFGRTLLGALAQGTDALKAKLKRTGAHESRHRRVGGELKAPRGRYTRCRAASSRA
jgi:hypothetical protein